MTIAGRAIAGGAIADGPIASGGGAPQTVNLGHLTETGTVNALAITKVRALGTLTETDSAHAITVSKSAILVALGHITETDTPYSLTISGGILVVPPSGEQPAGRPSRDRKPSRRKRKPVIVTIDGQDFVVSSEAEAQQLADAAAEIATQKAEEQAAAIIAKRERKARKADLNLAPLTLDLPQIEVRAPSDSTAPAAWLADVQARMQAVYDAYQAVADRAELALRVRHQQELDEEDELVTTILLS